MTSQRGPLYVINSSGLQKFIDFVIPGVSTVAGAK
jgi:hypothetical protein